MSETMILGLQITAVGVGTVFVALIITGIAVSLIGHIFKEKPPVPAAKTAPLPEQSFGGVDKHVLVLLAAAAAVAVKRPVRIRRVRFVSHKHVPAEWAATGRAEHLRESLD
jgi:Na+-transporting methylmalonyl-CoA/oxaloacetate decarboxylase gamma subunit